MIAIVVLKVIFLSFGIAYFISAVGKIRSNEGISTGHLYITGLAWAIFIALQWLV